MSKCMDIFSPGMGIHSKVIPLGKAPICAWGHIAAPKHFDGDGCSIFYKGYTSSVRP
ncbi:hypothetical protein GsuE55_20060 [Geobacillus subterraneus]|uniref:Uncharacterized protein n=1 Tax=Geobacillus subterraneus TaxID=129338 RepID=A0A679FMH1_9BACL|nr:hypothetical protein GsuE55_20060 [Geobacillus subterraneus]